MSDTVAPLEYFFLVFRLLVAHKLQEQWLRAYILKAKKFAKPPFQSKKLRKNCVNPGVIVGPFGVILSHFGSLFGHFGSYLGHFRSFLGNFVTFVDKFAESSIFLRVRWGHDTHF